MKLEPFNYLYYRDLQKSTTCVAKFLILVIKLRICANCYIIASKFDSPFFWHDVCKRNGV